MANRFIVAAFLSALIGTSAPVSAHPAPFSYFDIRLQSTALEVSLIVHAFDIAHELRIQPVDRVLESAVLEARGGALAALLRDRLTLEIDGRTLGAADWSAPEPLPERQSVRLHARYDLTGSPGMVALAALMFPYDPQHQTFVNFYEEDALVSQAILDKGRVRVEHFAGTRQGVLAVVQKFAAAGVHHILVGPDHLLFLIGLLLLGGSLRQLILVVSAFTLAHSMTLSLAALNLFSPPARVIEPAIALSIVYVGADNLMAHGGRDLRVWIAFAFGLIHGFGFASVLREMGLAGTALGWSLFSFNVGVEIGQLLVVIAVASALMAVRARSEAAGRRLALAGSIGVVAAGGFWFVERVFFPGGMA